MFRIASLVLAAVFAMAAGTLSASADDQKVPFVHCTSAYSGTPQIWLTTEFKAIPVAGDKDVEGYCFSEQQPNKGDLPSVKLAAFVVSVPRAFGVYVLLMDSAEFDRLIQKADGAPDLIVASFLGGKGKLYTADKWFIPDYVNRDQPITDGTVYVHDPKRAKNDPKETIEVSGSDIWGQFDQGNEVDNQKRIINPRHRQFYIWLTDLTDGRKLLVGFFSPIAGREKEYPDAPTEEQFRLFATQSIYQTLACNYVGDCPKNAQAVVISEVPSGPEGTSVADVNP